MPIWLHDDHFKSGNGGGFGRSGAVNFDLPLSGSRDWCEAGHRVPVGILQRLQQPAFR